jgi:tRNA-specific 2-thiouridylase
VLVEAFREHVEHPAGRGVRPPGAHDGSAGGAACGDLIRISLRVDGERVAAAGFEASGCGAMTAAGSAAVALVEGSHVLDVARVGPHAIAAELGGLSPGKFHAADLAADALHRALGAAARADAAVRPDAGRTLVAMSGGVDSAVAALLAEDRAAAVTLELWSDPGNDAEASCCSANAVRLARSLAHRMGLPHFTLDLREEFRAGVVDPFLAGHAAGVTPNPCVGCNGHVRLDAMIEFADRLGAATLTTGHYARTTPDGLLRAAADRAKDQTYMLAAVAPESLTRLQFPLGELTKPQVRALAAEAALPVASKAESQDLCFLAGTGKAAFLARHGALGERPGDLVDQAGRVLGRHRGHHHYTVGQRRGLGVAAAEPLYVLATDAAANRVVVGPREQLATLAVPVRGARLHRAGSEVDAVRLRYHARAISCRVAGDLEPGTHKRLELELADPVDGAAPGQTACLLNGDVVVGHGTIGHLDSSQR